MHVLVTGGAGYIGSHACVELLAAGHDVTVVDNLSNSSPVALDRVAELAGRPVRFFRADIRDHAALDEAFAGAPVDAVIHFAGLKAVGESVAKPLEYYQNNVEGTLTVCDVMRARGVRSLVFSSSCTVYGDPASVPVTESTPTAAPTNPYGRSKLMIEHILRDLNAADPGFNVALLRYFNPVGAHPSGRIGEDPHGIPNNLMPFVAQVAIGRLERLSIFGGDYATPDGTGVRDYIHVVDLALGHLCALDKLADRPGLVVYNLGTGRGHSVLEMVAAFERACGRAIPRRVIGRRPGDVAATWADPARAARDLRWRATRTIDEMCADTWRWQTMNPDGYRNPEKTGDTSRERT